jgi:hypothetical protein
MMDEYLEESYKSWKGRQRIRDAAEAAGALKKRKRLGDEGELPGEALDALQEESEQSEQSGSEEEEEEEAEESEEVRASG